MTTNNNDKKISQLANAAALTGTEVVPVVQGGATKKVSVADIAALASGGAANLSDAELIKVDSPIALGSAVIPANGTYTFTIPLGDVFDEVLLTSFQWVRAADKQDIPSARLGLNTFGSNSRYNFCLRVKPGAGNSVRLFESLPGEKKGASATPVVSNYGAKVSDVGVALGYDLLPRKNAFDSLTVNGKKVEISDVYLSGSNLIVKVANHESSSVTLTPYAGVSAVEVQSSPPGMGLGSVSVFGESSLAITSLSPYNGQTQFVSHDKGLNFFAAATAVQAPISTVAKGSSNDYFIALLDYNMRIRIVEGSGTSASISNPAGYDTGLVRAGLSTDPTGEDERQYNTYGNFWDYPYTGRQIDCVDKNLIVFSAHSRLRGRVDKFTNLSNRETILKLEDHVEYDSSISPHISLVNYVKVVDANTYFTSFSTYANYTPEPGFVQRNVLLKTSDGGATWTKLLEEHPEFCRANSKLVAVSDNGLSICAVAFCGTINQPAQRADKVFFNVSTDGGTTWKFPSGSWSVITTKSAGKVHDGLFNGGVGISGILAEHALHRTSNDNVLLIVRNNTNRPTLFRSTDNGVTFSDGDILSSYENSYPNAYPTSGKGFDANEHFIAFGSYGYISPTASIDNLFVGTTITEFAKYGAWALKS